MIKHFILLSLIVATLQIPNCKETKQVCKACINDDYVLVELNPDETKCMNRTEYEALNISNCAESKKPESECDVCKRDYLVDFEKDECLNYTHCSKLDKDRSCGECYEPFLLNKENGTCIEYGLCEELNGIDDKCKKCRPHYYPNVNGICEKIPIDHCKSYENGTNCTKCDEHFYRDNNNYCIEYPANCLYMDDKKKECTKCEDYFHPNGTICEKNPDVHCITMEGNTCTNCYGYFYPNDSYCVPYPENCIEMNKNEKICLKCNTSYDLDFENKCFPLPPNCISLNKINNRNCSICESSYYLDINETCQKKPANCKDVDRETGKCQTCNDYYHLVRDTCVNNPERCIEYDYQNKVCKSCSDSDYYYPYGKICKRKTEHCMVFNLKNMKCEECFKEYYEDEWTDCHPYPDKCTEFDEHNNKCLQCENNYYLNDYNDCVIKPEHCDSVNETTGICEKCVDFYYLHANKTCQPYPKNCSKVNESTDLCEECDNYYHLENNECVRNKEHCITQESNNCTKCDSGHFINLAKDCEENPEHCTNVNETTQNCTACSGYFYPEGKGCTDYPPHCISINQETKECIKCNETTHYLFNGTCYELPPNCKEVDNSNYTENCSVCNPYYHLDENKRCIDNKLHCVKMDDKGENCTICDPYYHPGSDECIENEDKNCITMDETATNCTRCSVYYYPNESYCVPYPEHCIRFNNIIKECLQCNDTYELDDNKECFHKPDHCQVVNTTSRKCKTCYDPFYLDQDQNCQEKPPHCSSVNDTTYKCNKCQSYYHLDKTFNCIQNPEHCSEIDVETEECLTCDKYFHPDGKVCKDNLDHCIYIEPSSPQKCRQCDEKYYYRNNYVNCEPLPPHCAKMNVTTKKCEECDKYYYLEDNKCSENPPHCDYYNVTAKECENCTGYYYLENKQCQPYPDNCISYNETNMTCNECGGYYYPVGKECEKYPPYCVEYDTKNNNCTKCTKSFYLDENGECKANPVHCNGEDPKTGKCNSCEPPYELKNDVCIKTCKEFEDVCKNCIENYGSFDYGKTCKAFVPDEEQKIYNLSIKTLYNDKYEINIGTNGILYLVTDYSDKIKEIFDISDMEEKTKFSTQIIDESNKEYNADCRLYKLTSAESQIAVICELKTNLPKGEHKVSLKEAKKEYKGYTFFIKSEDLIEVKQFETIVPFLYSDSQIININKDSSYELNFKSNGYNDGDILFIKGSHSSINYVISDDCKKNGENGVKCQLTKDKLKGFTAYEHDIFYLGIINDNIGAFLCSFVSFIQINYEVEQKKEVVVTINKLLTHETSANSVIVYETNTNVKDIPELITADFTMKFNNLAEIKCFFKKNKKATSLWLICNVGDKMSGQTSLILDDYNYLKAIHPEYNFMINPVKISDVINIQGVATRISLLYPDNINLSSEQYSTVRFVTDLSSSGSLPKIIKLNDKSYTSLECEDLINMKKCIVPLSHFEEQTTGEFYPQQILDNVSPTFYDTNPITVTLPPLITLKIEKKDNLDTVKIGQKGVIYLITDYKDDPEKFPQSSLTDLKFTGNFKDITGNDTYTSDCKLWRLDTENKNIRILCQLNENLKKENQEISLKQTSFMNGNLGVIVSYRADKINVKQLNTEMSFLYSEKQEITIKNSEDSYNLEFNLLHRDNGPLYLYSSEYKPIILDGCSNESNKLKCTVKKDKLLEILSESGEVFSIGEKYDNDGIYKFNSVLSITVKSEIEKKNIKIKIGKLLTNVVSKNEYIVYDTESEATDIKEITSNYIDIISQERNGKMNCLFKKNNNQNKLLFLCDAKDAGKGSLGNIPSHTYDKINALYNIEIEQSASTEEFEVLNTEGTKIYSVYPLVLNFNDKDEFTIQYEAQYPDNLKGLKLNKDSKLLECETKDGYKQCKVKQDYFSAGGDYQTYHLVKDDIYELSYELPKINVIFKVESTDGGDKGDGDSNTGLIIGLSVAGGVIVLAVVIFLIWHYCRKKDSGDIDNDDSKNKLLTST